MNLASGNGGLFILQNSFDRLRERKRHHDLTGFTVA